MSSVSPARLAVIGAGPRGIGVLERLAASLPELAPGVPIEIHLIDPHDPGAGRIWRYAQSKLLKLNSLAVDVTMFTDEAAVIDGPVREGPSLIEWAEGVRDGTITDVVVHDPSLRAELANLLPKSFPTRRLQSLYLDWFYRRAVQALTELSAAAGHEARVVVHRAAAVRVDDELEPDGTTIQIIELDDGSTVEADIVLYSIGHVGREPELEHQRLVDFAGRRELYYLPPAFTADADTRPIVPGQRVIVRGFGLAAIDLIVLLTEGRGGRYVRDGFGRLEYRASGREPRLAIGSRRGVPYHSKIGVDLVAPRPVPRYFTAETAHALVHDRAVLDFRDDVWPLIAKEMLWGYYWELFHGHPDRVTGSWDDFVAVLDRTDSDSPELRAAVDAAVPHPLDRLHLPDFDNPFAGRRFETFEELQEAMRQYIRDDLTQRNSEEHSASLGLFSSLLQALGVLGGVIDAPGWTPRSRLHDLSHGWLTYFSSIASGPPAHRLEELLALSDAGIVEFLGADLRVIADEREGLFRASGSNSPYEVRASALVDARLPQTSAANTDNAVLRSLVESGLGIEELVLDGASSGSTGRLRVDSTDTRLIGADGVPHARRYAVGPYTTSPFAGAFSRPRTNAVSFRENDRVARAILRELAVVHAEAGGSEAAGADAGGADTRSAPARRAAAGARSRSVEELADSVA